MEDKTYLSIAYLGMILGLAIWTWTTISRSRKLELRIIAMEESLNIKQDEADSIAVVNDNPCLLYCHSLKARYLCERLVKRCQS